MKSEREKMGLKKFFTNFHLKEIMDWNS